MVAQGRGNPPARQLKARAKGCPHHPRTVASSLHRLDGLIRSIVGLTLAVNLGGGARATLDAGIASASPYDLAVNLGVGRRPHLTPALYQHRSMIFRSTLGVAR